MTLADMVKVRQNSFLSYSPYIIAIALIVSVFLLYSYEIKELYSELEKETDREAQHLANQLEDQQKIIYQGLRTIARLPATRYIDRYGKNLDRFAQQSLQEIYNNLYTNVSLSEVYIVPLGFDPDRVDPITGELEMPIVTFDELIVGQNHRPSQSNIASIPEIEIYEYRAMKEQLSWFMKNSPTDKNIKKLDYPAIISRELITCDNNFLDLDNLNDKDRSGLIVSVPFFDQQGNLKGMVSGVFLSRILSSLLTGPNFRFVNSSHNYIVTELNSHPSIANNIFGNRAPIMSKPVNIQDNVGQWSIDYVVSSEDGNLYRHYENELRLWHITMGLTIVIGFSLFIIGNLVQRQRKITQKKNRELEAKVLERTQELESLNEELEKSNRVKTDFLSSISHELRTPLNAIIGYSDLLLDDMKESGVKEYETDLKRVNSAGTHLLSLIDEILDVSKIEAGKVDLLIGQFSIFSLAEEVIDTIKPVAQKNNTTVEFDYSSDIGSIESDWMRLKQVLLNLLSNAVKFTRNGKVVLKISSDNDDIVFEVIDTGIGMSEEQIQNVFTDFYQANAEISHKYGGTGLGLSISKRLCTLLKGEIALTSEIGKGTHFRLVFPSQFPDYHSRFHDFDED